MIKLNSAIKKQLRKDAKGQKKARKIAKFLLSYPADYDYENKVKTLVEIGEPAVPILINLLKESEDMVIGIVAEALGIIGDNRAISPLIHTLSTIDVNNDWTLKQLTLALIRFGYHAVPELLAVTRGSIKNNDVIYDILGEIGDPISATPILEAFGEKNEKVRISAAKALYKLKDKRTVAPLIMLLNDDSPGVRIYVAKALGRIGDGRAIEPLNKALTRLFIDQNEIQRIKESIKMLVELGAYTQHKLQKARNFERAKNYLEAAKLFESINMWDEAGRVRKLARKPSIPTQQIIAHKVDMSTRTSVEDSVLLKSTVGGTNQPFNLSRGAESIDYKYDIAISYASEDRNIVEKYAQHLINNNVKVFYDKFDKAGLWGKELNKQLKTIYQRQAKYCVMFISKDYLKKIWTGHELISALTRSSEGGQDFILPVKLDATEIPGVLPSVVFIDLRETSMEELVHLTLIKVKS